MEGPGIRLPSTSERGNTRRRITQRFHRGLLVLGAGAFLLTACVPAHEPNPAIKLSANPFPAHLVANPNVPGDPDNGRQLFTNSKFYPPSGCGSCHTLPNVSAGTFAGAPNLNNVSIRPYLADTESMRNTPAQMKAWIMDPPGQKPNAKMPKLNVSDQEATDLVAFLYSLPYNPPTQ